MGRPRDYFNVSVEAQANALQALFDQWGEQGEALAGRQANLRRLDQITLQALDQREQMRVLLLIEHAVAEKAQLHLQAGRAAFVIGRAHRQATQPGEVFERAAGLADPANSGVMLTVKTILELFDHRQQCLDQSAVRIEVGGFAAQLWPVLLQRG